jgi:hypothetical protein
VSNFQYWYLNQGGEGLPAGAIAYRDRVEADGGTVQSLGCVPSEVWDWVAPTYNAETLAMIAKAIADGLTLPSAANLSLISSTIDSLKAASAWSIADRITFWGNDSCSTGFGTINAKTPSADLATIVNSITLVNKKGVEGDGISAYVDTNYNPTTDAVNYGLNSASILLYQYKVATVGINLYGITGVSSTRLQSKDGTLQRINSTSNLSNDAAFDQIGTIGLHKVDSVNVNVQINSTLTARTYSGSSELPNSDFSIFSAPTGVLFCNAGVTMEWVGANASAVGVAIHTIMENYYNQLQLL